MEVLFQVSPYVAEFWNTLSNLLMVLLGARGAAEATAHGFEAAFVLSHWVLVGVGVGSWLFHMTLSYEMQLLDEIPMICGAAIHTYLMSQLRKRKCEMSLPLASFLVLYCLAFVAVYLVVKEPVLHEVGTEQHNR